MSEIQHIGEVLKANYPGCKASPLCVFHPEKNGYCVRHQDFAAPKKETKGIKKVADKRKEENKELAAIVKDIKQERPLCEMKVPGVCTGKTLTAHHVRGRVGKYLTDKKNIMAACVACNNWVENNHEAAVKMGLKKSRLNKTN